MAVSGAEPGDHALWQFSVTVYSVPGVADECLGLQERYGVDVNTLLFCAWLAFARRAALTAQDIEAIRDAVNAWHEKAVKPLRAVRRYLKDRPGSDVVRLRRHVKAVELEAERVEQAMLFAYAEAHWPARGTAPRMDSLLSNLEAYLRAHGYDGTGGEALPTSHLRAAVQAMSAAC